MVNTKILEKSYAPDVCKSHQEVPVVENLLNRVGKVGLALSLAWNLPTASG